MRQDDRIWQQRQPLDPQDEQEMEVQYSKGPRDSQRDAENAERLYALPAFK